MDGKQLLRVDKIAYFAEDNAEPYLLLHQEIYNKMKSLYGEMKSEPSTTHAFTIADKRVYGYNYH